MDTNLKLLYFNIYKNIKEVYEPLIKRSNEIFSNSLINRNLSVNQQTLFSIEPLNQNKKRLFKILDREPKNNNFNNLVKKNKITEKKEKIISYLKKKHKRSKVKNSSKKVFNKRSDCLRKRIKTHFNKYIYNKLTGLLSSKTKDILFKLPKGFIADINILTNKLLLSKTIRQLYASDLGYTNDYCIMHNRNLLKNCPKDEELDEFLNLTYQDAYKEYLRSDRFEFDMQYFRKKEDEEYAKAYENFANKYLVYYEEELPNDTKTKKEYFFANEI